MSESTDRRYLKQPWRDNPWGLTLRQMQIMVRLFDYGRRQIAAQLVISEHTVAEYIAGAFKKMDCHRAERACVLFDRWWQLWQKKHADELPAVWEELQL